MTKGERIKELRLKKGLTQVELAEKIHVSKQTLYKYENNIVTNIPSDKIESLAKVLETTPAYIMGWDEGYPITNMTKMSEVLKIAKLADKSVSELLGVEVIPEDYEPYGNIRVFEVLHNANLRNSAVKEYLTEPVQISVQSDEYYKLYELLTQAQEMFDDPDMRALFHMKKNMEPEKFKAHVNMMKELYRLEHPEDQGG